jgi:hypothetical protein
MSCADCPVSLQCLGGRVEGRRLGYCPDCQSVVFYGSHVLSNFWQTRKHPCENPTQLLAALVDDRGEHRGVDALSYFEVTCAECYLPKMAP